MLNIDTFPKAATRIRFPYDSTKGWYAISYVSSMGVGFIHGITETKDGETVMTGRHMTFDELVEENAEWLAPAGDWIEFK